MAAAISVIPRPSRKVLLGIAGAVGWQVVAVGGFALGLLLGAAFSTSLLALVVPVLLLLAVAAINRPRIAVGIVFGAVVVELRSAGGSNIEIVQLLGAFAILCVVLQRLLARRRLVRMSTPLLFGAGLIVAAGVSTLMADNVARALRLDANLLVGFGFVVAIVAVCQRKQDVMFVVRCFVAGSLLVTVPALANMGSLQSTYGGALVEGRLIGSFVQPNEFGTYAVMVLFASLGLLLGASSGVDRVLGLVGLVSSVGALIFSLSRGSWLGAGAGALALVILYPRVLRPLLGWSAVLAVVLVFVVRGTPLTGNAEVVSERVATLTAGELSPDDQRSLIWGEARRLVEEAPLVGHGPASFKTQVLEPGSLVAAYHPLHAHNVILNVAAELGLLGAAALLGLTAATAVRALRSIRRQGRVPTTRTAGLTAALSAGCASFIGLGMFDVTFLNPVILILAWGLLGLALAASGLSPTVVPRASDAEVSGVGGPGSGGARSARTRREETAAGAQIHGSADGASVSPLAAQREPLFEAALLLTGQPRVAESLVRRTMRWEASAPATADKGGLAVRVRQRLIELYLEDGDAAGEGRGSMPDSRAEAGLLPALGMLSREDRAVLVARYSLMLSLAEIDEVGLDPCRALVVARTGAAITGDHDQPIGDVLGGRRGDNSGPEAPPMGADLPNCQHADE